MQRKGDHIRIPPQSIEAEQAMLGSIMLRPEAIHEITDVVREEDFYSEKHRVIWRSCLDLMAKGNPIELARVFEL